MKLREKFEEDDPTTASCLGRWERIEQGEELVLYRLISKAA